MKKLFLNQKTYMNKDDVYKFISNIENKITYNDDIVIIPSDIYIYIYNKLDIKLGAQNLAVSNDGNQTGEITGDQLRSIGVKYVIIGHSERRINNFDQDKIINQKIHSALSSGLEPILCIGENLETRENKQYLEFLKEQLDSVLENLNVSKLIIAYEPIYSIGSGKSISVQEINEIVDFIRTYCKEKMIYPTILYGGSVDINNIETLSQSLCDGFLIGKASIDSDKVLNMYNILKG